MKYFVLHPACVGDPKLEVLSGARMTYFDRHQPCSFVQMLAAYLQSSTASEAHTLGMVTGLITGYRRKVAPSTEQRQMVLEDTAGRVLIGEGERHAVDGAVAAPVRSRRL